jgi:hypothetical protein
MTNHQNEHGGVNGSCATTATQAQLLACGGVEILRNSSTRILPVV